MDNFYRRISTNLNLPMSVAYREARIVATQWEELSDSFALLPDVPEMGPGGYVSSPILFGGRSVGALSLMYLQENAIEEVDRDLMSTLSYVLGMWVATSGIIASNPQSPVLDAAPLSLTARQMRILSLVREGLTSDEIGSRLGHSTSTVKQEIVRMKNALMVDSRQDLIEHAVRLSILP